MSKHYLESNRLYVMNEWDQVVYLINSYRTYYGANYLQFELCPVAYREHKSDWKVITAADRDDRCDIPEDQTVNMFFLSENLIECIQSNDYTIMINGDKILTEIPDDLNKIIRAIDRYV
jgi:hypothetical protein